MEPDAEPPDGFTCNNPLKPSATRSTITLKVGSRSATACCHHHTVSPLLPLVPLHAAVPFIVIQQPRPSSAGTVLVGSDVSAQEVPDEDAEESALSLLPEESLTQLEVSRTLQLCGVKRHRCLEAVQQLWDSFLAICYGSNNDIKNRNNNGGLDNNMNNNNENCIDSSRFGREIRTGDVAIVVRYDTFRDAPQRQRPSPVSLERLVAAAVALQRGSDTNILGNSSSGNSYTMIRNNSNNNNNNNNRIENNRNSNSNKSTNNEKSLNYIGRFALVVSRATFDRGITKLLSHELRGRRITVSPLPRWLIAHEIVRQQRPLVVFCGGTSGCGKTTLASLIANHLCISTVLSTDTIRQGLRKALRREEFPELYLSTYEAHRCSNGDTQRMALLNGSTIEETVEVDPAVVVSAYEKQCAAVLQVLDSMLERLIGRNQVVVVEGVNLIPKYMAHKSAALRERGVMCLTFLICITKEQRHMERFCTRARSMNLSPARNKYVLNFSHIRVIQQHLIEEAQQFGVRMINNTNVDKSLMVIHEHLLERMDQDSGGDRRPSAIQISPTGTNAALTSGIGGATVTTATPGSGDVLKQRRETCLTYADAGISGKRMLALLLLRRREKTRQAGGGGGGGGGSNNHINKHSQGIHGTCECCIAMSLLTQTTRSRSAESLTSFQLQRLSTCAYERRGSICGAGVAATGVSSTRPESSTSAVSNRFEGQTLVSTKGTAWEWRGEVGDDTWTNTSAGETRGATDDEMGRRDVPTAQTPTAMDVCGESPLHVIPATASATPAVGRRVAGGGEEGRFLVRSASAVEHCEYVSKRRDEREKLHATGRQDNEESEGFSQWDVPSLVGS